MWPMHRGHCVPDCWFRLGSRVIDSEGGEILNARSMRALGTPLTLSTPKSATQSFQWQQEVGKVVIIVIVPNIWAFGNSGMTGQLDRLWRQIQLGSRRWRIKGEHLRRILRPLQVTTLSRLGTQPGWLTRRASDMPCARNACYGC